MEIVGDDPGVGVRLLSCQIQSPQLRLSKKVEAGLLTQRLDLVVREGPNLDRIGAEVRHIRPKPRILASEVAQADPILRFRLTRWQRRVRWRRRRTEQVQPPKASEARHDGHQHSVQSRMLLALDWVAPFPHVDQLQRAVVAAGSSVVRIATRAVLPRILWKASRQVRILTEVGDDAIQRRLRIRMPVELVQQLAEPMAREELVRPRRRSAAVGLRPRVVGALRPTLAVLTTSPARVAEGNVRLAGQERIQPPEAELAASAQDIIRTVREHRQDREDISESEAHVRLFGVHAQLLNLLQLRLNLEACDLELVVVRAVRYWQSGIGEVRSLPLNVRCPEDLHVLRRRVQRIVELHPEPRGRELFQIDRNLEILVIHPQPTTVEQRRGFLNFRGRLQVLNCRLQDMAG
eukprot:scaffold110_cov247-Pinguiococcus_pyrenoidosus.AAC.5